MKKSIFLLIALLSGALNLFAQSEGCTTVTTTLSGTATIKFVRYTHKDMPGVFKVGAETYVRFSQGNLQYKASTNIWRFAVNQWDIVGNNAGNNTAEANRATQADWIDLFGWGTSGHNGKDPWMVSTASLDYGDGQHSDLVGDNAEYDWAYRNAIVNGGNASGPGAHQWRTLTFAEWQYLFNSRAAGLYGFGTLNGVYGIFLLPDNWDWDDVDGGTFETTWKTSATSKYTTNVIEAGDMAIWTAMENKGAVFLPVTYMRDGVSLSDSYATYGVYWTTTNNGNSNYSANVFKFSNGALDFAASNYFSQKFRGKAVRAVQDVPKPE